MSLPLNQIVCGDAFEILKGFPEESIDMTMLVRLFWGLRDYKLPRKCLVENTSQNINAYYQYARNI